VTLSSSKSSLNGLLAALAFLALLFGSGAPLVPLCDGSLSTLSLTVWKTSVSIFTWISSIFSF